MVALNVYLLLILLDHGRKLIKDGAIPTINLAIKSITIKPPLCLINVIHH